MVKVILIKRVNKAPCTHTVDWKIFVMKNFHRSPSTANIKLVKYFKFHPHVYRFSLGSVSAKNKTMRKFKRQNISAPKLSQIYGTYKILAKWYIVQVSQLKISCDFWGTVSLTVSSLPSAISINTLYMKYTCIYNL